jgi:hypothetical protein
MKKFVVPLMLLTLALGGCSKPQPEPQAKKDDQLEKVRAYTKCMRENGVDMQDPEPGGAGVPGIPAIGGGTGPAGEAQAKKIDAAVEKCASLLPADVGEGRKITPEDLAKARELSKCLRENGLPDFPDPDPETGAVPLGQDVKVDRDKAAKAAEKCGGMPTIQVG